MLITTMYSLLKHAFNLSLKCLTVPLVCAAGMSREACEMKILYDRTDGASKREALDKAYIPEQALPPWRPHSRMQCVLWKIRS